jgi:N-acetylneuraminic acid mutarotase
MPSPRVGFGIGVVNGILYAVGGSCCNPDGSRILGTVEAYDPTTNTWTARAPMPTPRWNLAVGVANQILYAVGGRVALEGDVPPNIVEAYDPARNVWAKKTPLPGNRNGVALGSVDGTLYAVGGVRWVPNGHDGPYSPMKMVTDPITYGLKVVP